MESGARLALIVFVVITAVDIADGPLLQRSIKSVVQRQVEDYYDNWSMISVIEDGNVGEVDYSAPASIFADGSLDILLNKWVRNQTAQTFENATCHGNCSGAMTGAGVAVNCSSSWRDLDIANSSNINATLFSVQFNRTVDSSGVAILEMTHLCK